ncbi:MAG: MBL fold metallo-hydrolase [Nocardioides sp.]
MQIHSFRTPGLGDQTYLFEHEGTGILVDPQRDIGRFLEAAAERKLRLSFVLETHLHNDYVSGGEQAALKTGADLVLPAAARRRTATRRPSTSRTSRPTRGSPSARSTLPATPPSTPATSCWSTARR